MKSKASAFIVAVVSAGALVLLHSLFKLIAFPPGFEWLLLASLAVLSGFFTIKVPSISATISVSETFVFTTVLFFGTPAATVTVALEAIIISSWRHRHDFRKVLFNATEPTLSIWIASTLFFYFVGAPIDHENPTEIGGLLLPMAILCITYFLLNSWLTATAIGLTNHISISSLWNSHLWWLCLNYFVAASVALVVAQNSTTVGLTTLGMILPILAVSFLTMRAAMGRLHDAQRHVDETDRLYMSTIESLAMAIDAKDQVTHGHIRRVQSLAVGLAKELGLQEPSQIKAIAASALLHDMGKLAIPEHILNKPGKLTEAEFERMKQHASVGAEILSSISFPYPVVPIVRHHHENWDGTGYPDGISGASIPIGARILSVVDCFDALTSDRPYRRKLADEDAVQILKDRRGTMYDPLIVDTFLEVRQRLRGNEQVEENDAATPTSNTLFDRSVPEVPRSRPTAKGHNSQAYDVSLEAITVFERHLALLFPGAVCAVFAIDADVNALGVVSTVNPKDGFELDLQVEFGKGVTGWVAANREIAFNADPTFDFVDASKVKFRYSISAPLFSAAGDLSGVITAYSERELFAEGQLERLTEATSVGSLIVHFAKKREPKDRHQLHFA